MAPLNDPIGASEKGLTVLIVEDEIGMSKLIERVVNPLITKWPNSIVITARKFAEAVNIIRSVPIPDIVLLDLTLPDSSLEQTIARLSEIEDHAPLVIVTGHSIDAVRKLLKDRVIDVVEKDQALTQTGFLLTIIIKAISHWHEARWTRIATNINRMRELIHAPAQTS